MKGLCLCITGKMDGVDLEGVTACGIHTNEKMRNSSA